MTLENRSRLNYYLKQLSVTTLAICGIVKDEYKEEDKACDIAAELLEATIKCIEEFDTKII